MKKIILFLGSTFLLYALHIGEIPVSVTLDKANGGTSQKTAWHSDTLKGRVHTLIYMDPDKRDDTKLLLDALAQLNDVNDKYSTVAIVNLAATWMPDSILEAKLKSKQKELKNMEYIFDKTKFLVKKWHFRDDASNVLVLDTQSRVMYMKTGLFTPQDVVEILKEIEQAK